MSQQAPEERMAENEAIFRDANERIEGRARELEFQHPVPFLCECDDAQCRALLRLPLAEYEAVRSEPTHFLIAPEHEAVVRDSGRIVRRGDVYLVAEKTGRSDEMAAERDPRQRSESG
jgi:hypothetical protein